jgi:hypothetical protein
MRLRMTRTKTHPDVLPPLRITPDLRSQIDRRVRLECERTRDDVALASLLRRWIARGIAADDADDATLQAANGGRQVRS